MLAITHWTTQNGALQLEFIPKNATYVFTACELPKASYIVNIGRTVTASSTGITFGDGLRARSYNGSGADTDNSVMIPQQIYGMY